MLALTDFFGWLKYAISEKDLNQANLGDKNVIHVNGYTASDPYVHEMRKKI